MKIKKLQSFFDVLFFKLKAVKGLHGITVPISTKIETKNQYENANWITYY